MVQFILTNVFMISLGAMIYIVARSLPRLPEAEPAAQRTTLIERWVMSDVPHKMDSAASFFLGKTFRRLKIVLMKCDNYLTARIKQMGGGTNGNAAPKIDFKEIQNGESIAKTDETDSAKG